MTDGPGARKRIGFLSFGHWQPIAGSQVRTVLVRFRCTEPFPVAGGWQVGPDTPTSAR